LKNGFDTTNTGVEIAVDAEAVHVNTNWKYVSTPTVVAYVLLVAPEMFVQGPVAEAALCHWYVIPEANVDPVVLKVTVVDGQTGVAEVTVVPPVIVPAHDAAETMFIK
jgi:hypothetical protein